MTDALASTTAELVAQLTLEEKILLVEGVASWNTNGVDRLGIPRLFLTDGPHGVRKVKRDAGAFGLAEAEPSSSFPTSTALAKTWNPDLARRVGEAIGRESAALGVDVLLAPGVNIMRSPLCGRNFEYFSEDPLLSGAFGAAFVRGVQSTGVAASVKHFAANSNEDFRFTGDSLVDERALREIYLRAFERIVREAEPATVMCAYNRLNGTYCSDNRELLTGILREEWGFDGLVMTDWGATHDRAAALSAGCDLDMPGGVPNNRQRIRDAISDGSLDAAALDQAVGRVLELVDRSSARPEAEAVDPTAHADLAEQVAVDGAVLLQNDGTLPLAASAGGLVVVGEMFEKMRFQGSGSSLITPPQIVSPRSAFDSRGIRYRYAQGYRALDGTPDAALETEARALAADASTVLFFGGLSDLEESEGFDRRDMAMSEAQTRLLMALVDAGAKVVLVLFAGAPVEIPRAEKLAGVLLMSLPGMRGGHATARVLFGEANPSGRLTESWPKTAADSSCAADFGKAGSSRYYESIYVGYRYHDKAGTTLRYPFGHGLSYTSFAYRDLDARIEQGRVRVQVTVANTGPRDGSEVTQVYVRNNRGRVFKADKELRAFAKHSLAAGEQKRIELTFALDDLAYWDPAEHRWVLENGEYEVLVAASAAHPLLSAPLVVDEGRASRSPYPREIDQAYAVPPRDVSAAFAVLLGRPLLDTPPRSRLELESRLEDAKRSFLGGVLYRAVVGRARKDYEAALALPDSLERDAKVKSSHFVMRMMPSMSLRSMVMSSDGAMPYRVAAGLADLAAGRPVRGLRRLLSRKERA